MSPRISVLMPVWNGEAFLAAAVDSVFGQTLEDFELLVVDDGSTDRTPEILRQYTDPRLRVIPSEHAGIVIALNHGIAQARADWIARLDADDISKPQRLEAQWRAVSKNPKAVLCHSNVEHFGENAPTTKPARLPRSRSFTALRLCYMCPISHSSVLFNKAVALAAGGYQPEERHAEDFSLWGRMLERGTFVGLSEKLVRFRSHAQSVSQRNLETQKTLTRRIGARHCRNFMRLDEVAANRANDVLATPADQRSWRNWWWFLTRCAPRLRWKSVETLSWLLRQSLKVARRR
jgi:glycosyltransferase involved in cell wall biosynthesis